MVYRSTCAAQCAQQAIGQNLIVFSNENAHVCLRAGCGAAAA
jgi:hypothetical protein